MFELIEKKCNPETDSEGTEVSQEIEVSLMKDGEKIGYAQLFKMADILYLASIEIVPEMRCLGYGTEALKQLARKHGGFYLCPENVRCVSLYERLGEDVSLNYPEELDGNVCEAYEEKIFYISD